VPEPREAISKESAYLITSMMEDVIQKGTGQAAKGLGRPLAGKTGTTNDFTDAWFLGFTPELTAGVWVGYDDKQISLGKKETGSKAALPIWIDFMKSANEAKPADDFPNVEPLSKLALTHQVHVDTPDSAPTEEVPEGPPIIKPIRPPIVAPSRPESAPGKPPGQ